MLSVPTLTYFWTNEFPLITATKKCLNAMKIASKKMLETADMDIGAEHHQKGVLIIRTIYDYQKRGDMRRYVAWCLNLDSRIRLITKKEIYRANKQVDDKGPTILSVTNHEEREMRTGSDWLMTTIRDLQTKSFNHVKICHANAVEAIRKTEGLKSSPPLNFYFIGNKIA
jgi:hypothetical protein